jgi:hypothetical protein
MLEFFNSSLSVREGAIKAEPAYVNPYLSGRAPREGETFIFGLKFETSEKFERSKIRVGVPRA